MRVSTYEMILPLTSKDGEEIPGYKLLINGLYGAMDIVSKEDAEEIASSNLSVLSSTLIEQFARRGHFTEKTAEEELDDLKLLARIYSKTFGRLSL